MYVEQPLASPGSANNLTISDVYGSLGDQENIERLGAQILRERKRIIEPIQTNKELAIKDNIPKGALGRGRNQ